MKYIVLDDEQIAASYLAELIKENDPKSEIYIFNNPVEALDSAVKENFDACFIDIQMPGLNGVDFAEKLKSVHPKTNIIFVTGHSDYMGKAFNLYASDYILKPANSEQIRHALDNLRYEPVNCNGGNQNRIKIICFGNFDILIDDAPVKFKFDKTKELLAFLIHRRGSRCTSKEIMATLWEDEGHSSYYRMLKKDLQDTLNSLSCGDIIHSERGNLCITKLDCMDCDYFIWLNNKKEGAELYHGEYMAQYSWAEEVNAIIEMEKYEF